VRNNRYLRIAALLLAFGLIAAACGDDDSGTTTEAPTTTAVATTEAPTTTAAPTTEAPAMDIVDTAIAADGFDTLVAAVQAADLVDTLKGDGPFTVFAPTDEAFAAALDALGLTADELLGDTATLTDILLYHVVEGEVLAETVVTLDSATTVQGSDITIEVVDGGVILNGEINVTTTDIQTSNGVIHVIDGVLLPPAGA
jgi:transforming growth factor-beta-induced protein